MARRTQDLNIYKDSYKLLQVISHAVKNMRKDFKHFLGRECLVQGTEILRYINKVNGTKSSEAKASLLDSLMEKVDTLQLNLRLCRDLHLIDNTKFAEMVELSVSVDSQCLKWKTYILSSKR